MFFEFVFLLFELWCFVVAVFVLQSDGGSLLSQFGFDIRLNLACGAQWSPSFQCLVVLFEVLVLAYGAVIFVWLWNCHFGCGLCDVV
ncbi:hypothetical protein L195_g010018 [Trifolium pratense]|uniref:Uncharacterized protein n=1 Tax=Trifolium pratense TaxID=57577 RepID=A0A2K3PDN5_TRIPR|nr:hypothetical protein L195_g010018 [Trifolium pratense]